MHQWPTCSRARDSCSAHFSASAMRVVFSRCSPFCFFTANMALLKSVLVHFDFNLGGEAWPFTRYHESDSLFCSDVRSLQFGLSGPAFDRITHADVSAARVLPFKVIKPRSTAVPANAPRQAGDSQSPASLPSPTAGSRRYALRYLTSASCDRIVRYRLKALHTRYWHLYRARWGVLWHAGTFYMSVELL